MSTRETVRRGLIDAIEAATERELVEQDWLRRTEDFAEGIKAMADRRLPDGVVWMRDGCVGLNRVTSGARALPEAALGLFHFTVGQAAYEAMVEVAAA